MPRGEKFKKRLLLLANRLRWLVLTGFVVNIVYVLLFMKFERRAFDDAIWWAWVTGFTVGYGDITPLSDWGRLVGIAVMATNCILLLCVGAQVTAIILINKDIFSHTEQELLKRRAEEQSVALYKLLCSNYRIERKLGTLPPGTPEPTPPQTNEEILAELERKEDA